ncbi:MAG: hypothetical protein PUE56_04405 [Clostridium sp.]|nr:hypothetical protein [Clostridium sp.]
MRMMERNKTKFYYALFEGQEPIEDEYHNETGEFRKTFTPFIEAKWNISPARGNTQVEQFGMDVQYDKVIVIDDMTCPIDENTVLCVDTEPSYDNDGNPIYDYIVRKVAKSLNSISIAISKVQVS